MRLHIQLADDVVAALDARLGDRPRSTYIAELITRALADEQRWDDLEESLGAIADTGHEWDRDVAAWVQAQRGDDRRAG